MRQSVKLGSRVKCIVSGFEGIAVARCSEVELQVIDDGIHVAPVERAIGFRS